MRHVRLWGLIVAFVLVGASAQAAGTLRVGMQDDPDALDPALGGTFAGRIVFASLCDKLIELNDKLQFVPQLATAWSWSADSLALTLTLRDGVTFQDGEKLDADAVKANIERYRSAPYSSRRSELKPVTAVEVVDPKTVRLVLSQPYAPLIAVLSDRAGMMAAPKVWRRIISRCSAFPDTGTPVRSISTGSSSIRLPILACAWSMCRRGSLTWRRRSRRQTRPKCSRMLGCG
jgi:ABC-type transport system substrate-binding protein